MRRRILSLLLATVMVLGMLPAQTIAATGEANQVRVIVENTTFTTPVKDIDGNEVTPAWTGTLVDTWVALTEDATAMSCIGAALAEKNYTATGLDSGYISEINGLKAMDGGSESGWMGTLNDWFINEGFSAFTVANSKLTAGDEIRVMYTSSGYGADLGGSWSSTDKTVKTLAFSDGELNEEFSPDTHEYILTIPEDVSSVVVTPTASNKNYQVRTYVGETEYKRTADVPVEDGTEITVKCGDPSWASMNANDGEAQIYTVKVQVEQSETSAPSTGWDGETQTQPQTDSDGVYQIGTGAELAWFVATSEKETISGKLTADIDLGNYPWVSSTTSGKGQIICLDGDGHKVTGLNSNLGLFGVVSSYQSVVKNLSVYGTVTATEGQFKVGGIAAYFNGTMENCINYASVTGSIATTPAYAKDRSFAGGLTGYTANASNKFLNCANYGVISGTGNYVGGLIGYMAPGCTITGCYNTGNVSGGSYVGGLVGGMADSSSGSATVTGCYNTGNISGSSYVGGLFGLAKASNGKNPTQVNDCYSAGTVTGTSDTNPLFGKAYVADKPFVTTSGCCYLDTIGTDNYGTARTEAQLKACDGLSGTYFKSSCGGYPAVVWQTILNHAPNGAGAVTAPTCVDGGYTTYTCSVCGTTYKADLTAALGHKYCDHDADTTCAHCTRDPEPTLTASGTLKRHCQNGCGTDKEEELKPLISYTVTLPTEPVGYTVTAAEGSTSPVVTGGSFSFTVIISDGYTRGENFAVKANDTVLTEASGVYTITNITENQTVTVTGVREKTLADSNVTITAPAGSTISFGTGASYSGHQFATALETTADENGVTAIYAVPGAATFCRVQNPDGVTYWNFYKAGGLKAGDVIEVTAEMLHIGDTGEDAFTRNTVYHNFEKNNFDVADLYLNINARGYLNLDEGGTKKLNAVRNWQAIENYMNSEIAVPDVHYQVIDVNGNPSDIVTIEPDANKSMEAVMTANRAGTAIVLVTYDAMTDATGQGGERFSAIWPENTGVFVVTVGAADSSGVQTNMTINEGLNTVSGKLSVDALDAEHDVLYYLANEGGASYSFTPESGCTVEVLHPTLTDTAMTYTGGFTTQGVATNTATGEVTLSGLTTGTHIVKITKGELVTYQLIRAKEASVSIVDGDGNTVELGGTVEAGTELKITYHGIYNPTEKLSGIYNFTPRLFYVDEDGNVTYSAAAAGMGVYVFGSSDALRTFTYKISDFAESSTLTLNGGIATSAYGRPAGAHRVMENAGADLAAIYREAQLGRLPTVTLQIQGRADLTACTIRATDGTNELSNVTYTATNSAGEAKTFTGTSFKIPVGTYTLTAEAEGYVVVRNMTIEVTAEGENSFSVTLTKAGADPWDGESFSAPSKDDNGVWQISNAEELFWYATECNNGLIDGYDAVLTADIELAGHAFTAIDTLPADSVFDGRGHAIRNLYATYTSTLGSWSVSSAGAFVNICKGTIQNLTITGIYEVYTQNTTEAGAVTLGAFAGKTSGTIQNCTNEVDITVKSLATAKSKVQVGGITGQVKNLTDCINRGNITVDVEYNSTGSFIGGIAGIYTGTVERCANYGNIVSKQYFANYIGGIAGMTSTKTASVIDCYNAGNITAEKSNCVGGIVGRSQYSSTVTNCFNVGTLQAGPQQEGIKVYISAISNDYDWPTGATTVYTNNYYLTGSVPEGYTGSAASGFKYEITEDVEGQIEAMTAAQFADGTVLAALSGESGTVFGQRTGTDAYPIFQSLIDADAAAAAAVIAQINAIGEVTLDSKSAIEAAEAVYAALTDVQKTLVTNYEILTAARAAYNKLVAESSVAPITPVAPSNPGTPDTPDTPSEQETPAVSFADVAGHWAEDDIVFVVDAGIMNGTGSNAFSPDKATTRGMIVTILARLEGVDTTGGSSWYALGRQWAMEMGISDGTDMEGQITREQLATMLYRYARLKGYDTTARASLEDFDDASGVSDWAQEAMQWAVGTGLIRGSNGLLNPGASATRAEVAAILHRFVESLAD